MFIFYDIYTGENFKKKHICYEQFSLNILNYTLKLNTYLEYYID